MSESSGSGSNFGCLSLVVTVIVLWAVFFGVTLDGKHYNLGCSSDRGVEIR